MKRVALLLIAGLLAGCAARTGAAPAAAPSNVYTGEVWNWDDQENTVTLRQGTRIVRLLVTPDQLIGLRLHDTATVRGEPAGPAPIATVVTPSTPMRPVPQGTPEQVEMTGTVRAVDPQGRASIETARGPVEVWLASGDVARFPVGTPVTLRLAVQPVQMVPTSAPVPPPSPLPQPSASIPAEPGDYAVVIGRVLTVAPTGAMMVEAPRGPIAIWVPDANRFHAGETVQVRSAVYPTR